MKIILVVLIPLFLLFCCKEKRSSELGILEKRDQDAYENKESSNVSTRKQVLPENLKGTWFRDKESNAVFDVSSDSVYYVDNLKSYKYEISSDTLLIDLDGWTSKSLILKLTRDSLTLMDLDDHSVTYLIK
jgi:hypothetical protein